MVAAAVACLAAPAAGQSIMKPPAPDVRIEQKLDAQVPLDLVFRDEQGRAKPLREFVGGKPTVLVLAYYRCPKLCSEVLNGLIKGLRLIKYDVGNEFNVVTVSIDPRETPEMAADKKASHVAAYGRPGAAAGWHFLTGDEPNIRPLAAAVGFGYEYDKLRDEFAHASGVMILTPDGKVSRYFYGIDYISYDRDREANGDRKREQYGPTDLQYGLEDAADGKIGSAVGQTLRLLCFGYDPTKGRYTLLVLNVLRLGGVLTVALLGTYLAVQWARERRAGRATPDTTAG